MIRWGYYLFCPLQHTSTNLIYIVFLYICCIELDAKSAGKSNLHGSSTDSSSKFKVLVLYGENNKLDQALWLASDVL